MTMSETKVCTRCLQALPLEAFNRNRRTRDGRRSRCRSCTRDLDASYIADPVISEKRRGYARSWWPDGGKASRIRRAAGDVLLRVTYDDDNHPVREHGVPGPMPYAPIHARQCLECGQRYQPKLNTSFLCGNACAVRRYRRSRGKQAA
jgi:ferredoxin